MNSCIRGLAVWFLALFVITVLQAEDRPRTAHWTFRNQLFEHEAEMAPKGRIVFLGDSMIEGFDLEDAFPGLQIINRGIVGDHLDGLIQRLHNSASALDPKQVFIMIGINDIGDQRSDDYLRHMYALLVDTLQQVLPSTELYMHSMLPTSKRWKNCPPEQIIRMNEYLEILCMDVGIGFIDLYPLFAGPNARIKPHLSRDGLHPNQQGYDLWIRELRPLLSP